MKPFWADVRLLRRSYMWPASWVNFLLYIHTPRWEFSVVPGRPELLNFLKVWRWYIVYGWHADMGSLPILYRTYKKFPFYLILCSCSACVVLVPKVPGISVKRATRIRRWTGRLSSNVVFCSVLVDDPVLMFIYEKWCGDHFISQVKARIWDADGTPYSSNFGGLPPQSIVLYTVNRFKFSITSLKPNNVQIFFDCSHVQIFKK
jgi:hypothetical protein